MGIRVKNIQVTKIVRRTCENNKKTYENNIFFICDMNDKVYWNFLRNDNL